jgi:hypothetical protein
LLFSSLEEKKEIFSEKYRGGMNMPLLTIKH